MDASTPLYLAILLLGVFIGLLFAWSPRLVVYRLHKRVAELEFTILSERNKRAASARWERDPAKDPLVRELMAAKGEKAQSFDNDWPSSGH